MWFAFQECQVVHWLEFDSFLFPRAFVPGDQFIPIEEFYSIGVAFDRNLGLLDEGVGVAPE